MTTAPAKRSTLPALAVVGVFVVVLLRTAWMSDDAYITLRTVDNLVHGFGLRWNVDERVQTFTHPLWMLALSALYALTREAFVTTIALSAGASLAAMLLLVGRFRTSDTLVPALVVLVLSRSFVDYSTSGLENPLTHLLLVLFVLALERERAAAIGLCAGLAVLNRMDTLLLVAPGVAVFLARARSWSALLRVAAGTAPFVLWAAFATFYYGFPYPNTAPAKLATGIPAGELWAQGVCYLANSLRTDPVTLPVIALGIAVAATRRRLLDAALAAGIALHLVYVVKVGGDFMSGRMLSAPLLLSVVALVRADPLRAPVGRWVATFAVVVVAMLGPFPTVVSGSDFGLDRREVVDVDGIADERRYYFANTGLLNGSDAFAPRSEDVWLGEHLRRTGATFHVAGAVGLLGFGAGPDVHVLDYHALGDPLLARLPMVDRDPLYASFVESLTGERPARSWRVGHYLRRIPTGYATTLLTGENRIADERVAEVHDRLLAITRGPLWSPARLLEIVRANLGGSLAVGLERPAYRAPPWQEIVAARPDEADAHFRLAEQRAEQGDVGGALAGFERAVELDPTHVSATINLAILHQQRRDETRTRLWLARAEALAPGFGRAHVFIGRLWLALGDLDHALECFATAVRIDPTQFEAHRLAAEVHLSRGDADAAVPELRAAIRGLPPSAALAYDLGFALAAAGNPEAAMREFESAYEIDPVFTTAELQRAAALGSADARAALERLRP